MNSSAASTASRNSSQDPHASRDGRVSATELAELKESPLWSAMAALTPTWVRECEAIAGLEFGVERFAGMAAPTLLLLGTATAAHHIEASRALERTLPEVRSTEFAGESHFAHLTATDQVVSAVGRFAGESLVRLPGGRLGGTQRQPV